MYTHTHTQNYGERDIYTAPKDTSVVLLLVFYLTITLKALGSLKHITLRIIVMHITLKIIVMHITLT